MNRKQFIARASIVSIAPSLLLGCTSSDSANTSLELVDTHQHLLDTRRFPDNWGQLPVMGHFGTKEYQEMARQVNIVKAVYVEVGVPSSRKFEEAQYAIELCEDPGNLTAGAVISYDLYAEDFIPYMEKFKGSPHIKGIRSGIRNSMDATNEKIIKHVRALGEMGLSLDVSLSPKMLGAFSETIKACPDTYFMINHCANVDPKGFAKNPSIPGYPDHDPGQWRADLSRIAENKNVACKISGVVTRSPGYILNAENLGPAVEQCLDIFGTDRVMFASDWPWCLRGMDAQGWVAILKEIVSKRPRDDQEKLFSKNAITLYRL